MDESQRVLFARLLCSSQLSHFGDVMVFISRPVERGGGPPESLHRGSENKGSIQQHRPEKQAVMSRRPRTQTHVMTQNTTCLESDQLLLLIITVGGLSVSRQTRSAWKRGQDGVLPTKTLFRQPSSAGSLSGRFI